MPPHFWNLLVDRVSSWRSSRPLYLEGPQSRRRSSFWPLLLLLLFLASVTFTLVRQRGRVRNEQALILLEEAEVEIAAARDLVGLDDGSAGERLAQARELLDEARAVVSNRRQLESLLDQVDQVEEQLLKIEVWSESLVYDFGLQGKEVRTSGLVFEDASHLLILDTGQNRIYRLTLSDGGRPQVEIFPVKVPEQPRGIAFDDELGLVWGEGEVLVFNQKAEVVGRVILDPSWGVIAAHIYGGNVYLLAEGLDQILKIAPQLEGEGKVSAWLKDKVELDPSARLGIDGDIFLWTDGLLRRFRRGREIDFELIGQIGDPLEDLLAVKIWRDSDALFLVDANWSRALVFSRDGLLLSQYVSENRKNLLGVAISPEEDSLYYLEQNRLLGFGFE